MQTRLQSYGDPVVAADVKDMLNSLASPVVLFGFDFFVDAVNRIAISAGACITAQGIMVIESDTQYLIINNTASPANYTIVYQHVDENIIGGTPAVLVAKAGLVSSDATGVVLGWVKYPGSAVPLAQSQFYPRRKANISEFNTVNDTYSTIYPFLPKMFEADSGGGIFTLTDTYDTTTFGIPKAFLKIENNDIITGYRTYIIPVRAGLYAPGQLVVSANCPLGSQVTFRVLGKDGSIFVPENNQIVGTTGFVYRQMPLPKNDTISSNSMFFIEARFDLNFSKIMYLESIGYNTYSNPI